IQFHAISFDYQPDRGTSLLLVKPPVRRKRNRFPGARTRHGASEQVGRHLAIRAVGKEAAQAIFNAIAKHSTPLLELGHDGATKTAGKFADVAKDDGSIRLHIVRVVCQAMADSFEGNRSTPVGWIENRWDPFPGRLQDPVQEREILHSWWIFVGLAIRE